MKRHDEQFVFNELNNANITTAQNEIDDDRFLFNVELLTNRSMFDVLNFSKNFWQMFVIDKFMKTIDNLIVFVNLIQFATNFITMIKSNFAYWFQFTINIKFDMFHYTFFDAFVARQHNFMKKLFDNIDYQRKNTKKSCREIKIERQNDQIVFRIFDMSMFIKLEY